MLYDMTMSLWDMGMKCDLKENACTGSVVLILDPKLFDIVGGGLGGVALMEEVYHLGWTLRVHSLSPFHLLSAFCLWFKMS